MPIRDLMRSLRPGRAEAEPAHTASVDSSRQQIADRPGPPAVALARIRYVGHPYVIIDPLETECRLGGDGVEVRAWIRLAEHDIPPEMVEAVVSSTRRLQSLPTVVRHVFFLRTAYGIPFVEIEQLLGMRRRSVRRAMLQAIAALDTESASSAS